MGHFPVLVLSKDGQSLCNLLAPFNENLRAEKYAITKDELIENSKLELKEYLSEIDFREYLKDPEKYRNEYEHTFLLDYFVDNLMEKINWTDEEHYQNEVIRWRKEDIGPDGEVYSYWNPCAEYDWYVIGGRWHSFIRLKPDAKSGAVIDNVSIPRTCVSAKVNDIDFSPNIIEHYKAEEYWDHIFESEQDGSESQRSLKSEYGSKERYALAKSEMDVYAIISPDGKWNCTGWIGHNEKGSNAFFDKTFKETFIDNADPEWRLTIVDCHYTGQCI